MGDRLRNIESASGNGNAANNTTMLAMITNDFDEEVEEELNYLPLKNEEDLTNFEKRLKDPDFKRKVVSAIYILTCK